MSRKPPQPPRDAQPLCFAVEPLEPRLLLSAEWAFGLAPDDQREANGPVDVARAERMLGLLAPQGPAPLPLADALLDVEGLWSADTDAPSADKTSDDPRFSVTASPNPPQAVDDDFQVNEDQSITFDDPWFDRDWVARRELSLDNSGSTTDLADFPLLVILDATRIDYGLTQDDGQDLRFTDANGNVLAHEIEVWDQTGKSYVWVRVNSIAAGADGGSIFMYYGNPDAADGQDSANVWTAGFEQVQHLDENGNTYIDSLPTGSDIDLTVGDGIPGGAVLLGQAHDFDGSDVLESETAAYNAARDSGTVSFWVQVNDRGVTSSLLHAEGGRDLAIWIEGGTFRAAMFDGFPAATQLNGGLVQAGWNHVAVSWDVASGDFALYVNGELADSDGSMDFTNFVLGGDARFGGAQSSSSLAPERVGLDGAMDEIRVSSDARTAAWISAQFASMSDSMITFGAEEAAARGVLANDVDVDGNPLAAVLESGPAHAASFTLYADGSFDYTPTDDFAGTDSFTYRTFDGTSLSGNLATVVITVSPVNDAPSATLPAGVDIGANSGQQSVAGFVLPAPGGGDDEAGQTFTYRVVADDPTFFFEQPSISDDGTLTFAVFDGLVGSTTVRVVVVDSGGTENGGIDESTTYAFDINVAEAPAATNLNQAFALLEDSGSVDLNDIVVTHSNASTVVTATLQLDDPASGVLSVLPGGINTFDSVTGVWTVTGELADVNAALAAVRFTPAQDVAGNVNIAVAVRDSFGFGPDGFIQVDLAPVNDAPSAVLLGDIMLDEDAARQVIAGFASGLPGGGADEAAQTLSYVVTPADPSLFDELPQIASDGTLTFTLAPNVSGSTRVDVQVIDSGGTLNGGADTSPVYSFNVTVAAQPNAPALLIGSTRFELAEDDAPIALTGLSVDDVDPGDVLTVSLSLSDPSLGGLSSSAGSFDANTGVWSVSGDVASVNAALADLVFAPAADANGSAELAVRVRDGLNTGPDGTIQIAISPVNDAPSLIIGGDLQVDAGTGLNQFVGFASALPGGGADEAGQTLSYTVTVDRPDQFSVAPTIGSDGTLAFSLADGAKGAVVVTVRVSDSGGTADGGQDTSAAQSFVINVLPPTTASEFSQLQTFLEDAARVALDDIVVDTSGPNVLVTATLTLRDPGTGALTADSASGETYDAASGRWQITATPERVNAALAAVSFRPQSDFTGDAVVDARIVDEQGNGPAVGTIVLRALAVNDAPVVSLAGDQDVLEDGGEQTVVNFAQVLANGGADEAGQRVRYTLATDAPELFAELPSIDQSGTLRYTLASDANGVANVTVVAVDDGGRDNGGQDTSQRVAFAVRISPVNDAPVGTDSSVTAPATGSLVLGLQNFGFSDPVDGDTLRGIVITALPELGSLTLDGQPLRSGDFVDSAAIVAGRLAFVPGAAQDQSVIASLSYRVQDAGGTADGGRDLAASDSQLKIVLQPVQGTSDTSSDDARLVRADDSESEQDDDEASQAQGDDALAPIGLPGAVNAPTQADALIVDAAPPPLPVLSLQSVTAQSGDGARVVPTAAQTLQTSDAATRSPGVAQVVAALVADSARALDATLIDLSTGDVSRDGPATVQVLTDRLGQFRESVEQEQETAELVIVQSSALAFGLSVGYVSWLLRGGILLSSMLTSLPAWRFIDPLPIFAGTRMDDGDNESLQDIVVAPRDAPAPAPQADADAAEARA